MYLVCPQYLLHPTHVTDAFPVFLASELDNNEDPPPVNAVLTSTVNQDTTLAAQTSSSTALPITTASAITTVTDIEAVNDAEPIPYVLHFIQEDNHYYTYIWASGYCPHSFNI